MQHKTILSNFLFVFIVLSVPDAFADYELINEEILKHENSISQWETNAVIVSVLTVAVAIFGGVTTMIQGLKMPWVKVATVVLGVCVVASSSIKDYYYEDSKKGFLTNATKASNIINSVKVKMKFHDPSDMSQEFYMGILRELSSINSMQLPVTSIWGFNIVKPAFAATSSDKPWLEKENYEDSLAVYFVGRGEGDDYRVANNLAGADAYKKMLTHYLEQARDSGIAINDLSSSALDGTIKGTAELIDTIVIKESGGINFTLVLRLSKQSRDFALKIFKKNIFNKQSSPSVSAMPVNSDVNGLVESILLQQQQVQKDYSSESFNRY